jgi:hypothetical protein
MFYYPRERDYLLRRCQRLSGGGNHMQDLHNLFKDDVFCTQEKIWQASMVAATEERRWEGRRIIGRLEWASAHGKKQAIMVLDDGTRYVRHEEGAIL